MQKRQSYPAFNDVFFGEPALFMYIGCNSSKGML